MTSVYSNGLDLRLDQNGTELKLKQAKKNDFGKVIMAPTSGLALSMCVDRASKKQNVM